MGNVSNIRKIDAIIYYSNLCFKIVITQVINLFFYINKRYGAPPLKIIFFRSYCQRLYFRVNWYYLETNIYILYNITLKVIVNPAGIYLFKVSNGIIITMCEICSKLTKKTPERRHNVFLASLLLTLNRFHTLLWCLHCWVWVSKYRLGIC